MGCRQENRKPPVSKIDTKNEVRYATGLSIRRFDGYSLVNVTNPWPSATRDYSYVLKQKNGIVPDSLKNLTTINVPIKKIIVTSTTHIPSLEMLGVENSLVGFPETRLISSEKIRANVANHKVRELGSNQALNTEVVIDLQPDVIIGYGIDNNNATLDNLEKSGLKILLNGDWNEQQPLGKAEWIKLFGALYCKEKRAESLFDSIVADYKNAIDIVKNERRPMVLMGGMFENKWNVPNGESWGARFIKDANGSYPWADTKGTGSIPLPFEAVLEKAGEADVWIGPGQFSTRSEMLQSNPHYSQFKAFKNKNVYTFKIGKTGGILYYELAPNRPDFVMHDLIRMLHPDKVGGSELIFFEKMK
jgi:iron complex transport system substrate-binding protein